jgi:hypothetical protein
VPEEIMVDYGKLIDEERARGDSAVAFVEAKEKKDAELTVYFAAIESALVAEVAAANPELERRGAPAITGPYRPMSVENRIELGFGTRNPCCRLSLESTAPEVGLSRIHAELLDENGAVIARTDFVIEGEAENLKTYKSLVEGFPDRDSRVGPAEMAQAVVAGILRGRFV